MGGENHPHDAKVGDAESLPVDDNEEGHGGDSSYDDGENVADMELEGLVDDSMLDSDDDDDDDDEEELESEGWAKPEVPENEEEDPAAQDIQAREEELQVSWYFHVRVFIRFANILPRLLYGVCFYVHPCRWNYRWQTIESKS